MNEYDLFDALGGIDDDLLVRSERRTTRKLPLRKALIAAAAVMLLAVTVLAAPIIRELLFPTEAVQISEGRRQIYGDLYLDLENDEYRIDLEVDSTAPLPTEIEEVRLPLYMIENDWLVSYGEIDAVYSEGPVHFKWWDRDTPKWVTFDQKCIPQEGACFELETYHGAELTRETVTIDGIEIVYYIIPPYWNQDTWESYPRETAVYWSDGAYAYHLQCSMDLSPEEIAEIVLSVQTIEDVTPYLKNDPNNDGCVIEVPPLDVHRMPTAIPAGYELKVCVDDDWYVTWIWENEAGNTIRFIEGHDNIYTNVYLAEKYKDQPEYSREDLQIEGRTVYSIHYTGCQWIFWEDGNYCHQEDVPIPFGHVYDLWWKGNDSVTLDDMLEIMESVTEVEDISQYLTQ